MRRALLLTVVLVAAVALPSATPAERGKLTVRSVATPRGAIPGSSVNVTAHVGHTAEMMSGTVLRRRRVRVLGQARVKVHGRRED